MYYSYPHYLNEIIIFQPTIIGFTHPKFISHVKPLEYITSCTGNIDRSLLSTSALQLVELFQTASQHSDSEHRHRLHVAATLGLLSTVERPIKFLSKLSSEYPPRKHIILENYNEPIPPLRLRIERTCSFCTDYHILDESQLSFTLSSEKSAMFLDSSTNEVIAIVIRNFAQGYFPFIKEWGTELIKNSISRRILSQRNNPGKLARVGISEGPRNARLFGWVRNLKYKFKTSIDKEFHEQNISSLFGLFYALLHRQVPWLADQFENVMSSAQLPRLDSNGLQQITIPFPNHPITFQHHPLAPPEGYLTQKFCKDIHQDKHWHECPWGCFWNLERSQGEGKVGLESGASFFIADYSLRIVNASNTFVPWKIPMWHGTGWYYNNVVHTGLVMLLSQSTERTWEEYKEKVRQGELGDGNLLWYPVNEASP